MADNTQLSAAVGSGDTIRTEDRTTFKTPVSLLDVGGTSAEALIGDSGVAMPVRGLAAEDAAASGNPVPAGGRYDATPRSLEDGDRGEIALTTAGHQYTEVSASALPTGAATSAKQDTAQTSLTSIDGKITACNTGSVTIGAALPAGTNAIGKLAANSGVDIGDVDVTSVSGNVTVVQGTATNLKAQAEAYQGGTAVGSGNPLQVTLANGSVPSHAVTNAGTFATQAQPTPVTSGGLTPHSAVGAASTNATVVKASAGQLYEVVVTNINASPVYFKLYNKATTPDENDTPVWRVTIPGSTAGSGFAKTIPMGLAFATGIAYRLVGGIADNSTTATSANEQLISLGYK